MFIFSKKILHIFTFGIITAMHAMNPSETDKTASFINVPRGLSNFPLIFKKNDKVYEFPGVCGQISQFQVLCAGIRAAQATIRHRTELIGNTDQASILATGIREHLESTGKKTIDFRKIIAGAFFVPMEGVRQSAESLMLKKDGDAPRSAVRYVDMDKFDNNNAALWSHLNNNNNTLPPLLAMDISRKQRLTIAATYEETKTINGRTQIPYVLSVVDDTQDPQKIKYYELAGVSQTHNYGLQLARKQQSTAKSLYQGLFRGIGSIMPSATLMFYINTPWVCHVDAYVRYDDSWYVLDDDTRWKASIISADQQSKVRTASSRDAIGKLLTQSYPGAPLSLLYNEIDKADYERLRQSPQQDADGQQLHLERDTPVSLGMKLKLSAALISGAACDAAMVGLATTALASMAGVQNPEKLGEIVAAATGAASISYHAQHISPMLSTSKTYTPHAAGLGPREPLR
jgi:hypothetical protein